MREEVEVQRRKVDAREQEKFAAQYQLVGLQESIDSLSQQKRIIEEERDALKTSLKEEEVARIAAEGRIALPVSIEGEEFASPKKRRAATEESYKENIDPERVDEHDELVAVRDELRLERRLRQRMDDQIHFMKMECQFQCCSCRVAERQGIKFLHDGVAAKAAIPPTSHQDVKTQPSAIEANNDPFIDNITTPAHHPTPSLDDSEPLIKFSPTTGTFYKTPSPPKRDPVIYPTPLPPTNLQPPSPPQPSTPQPQPSHSPTTAICTPFPHPSFTTSQTIIKTTTITVPLAITPAPLSVDLSSYPTMTRERALEQIRARRGRARSIASAQGTPRRVMVPGAERRDISAPAGRS